MKRSELLALAEQFEARKRSPVFGEIDDAAKKAADILRQIAEAQPVGWKWEGLGSAGIYLEDPAISGADKSKGYKWSPLYTLPMEE